MVVSIVRLQASTIVVVPAAWTHRATSASRIDRVRAISSEYSTRSALKSSGDRSELLGCEPAFNAERRDIVWRLMTQWPAWETRT